MNPPDKLSKQTRELVETAVGADIAGHDKGNWAKFLVEPMHEMSQEEKSEFMVNLTFNAVNSLSQIVQRAAAEQNIDPLLYWATHVKLTTELAGD